MSINPVTKFRDCDFCDFTIQQRFYWQYGNFHCHDFKTCLAKIDPEIRNKFEFKEVQTYQRPEPRYAKKGSKVTAIEKTTIPLSVDTPKPTTGL